MRLKNLPAKAKTYQGRTTHIHIKFEHDRPVHIKPEHNKLIHVKSEHDKTVPIKYEDNTTVHLEMEEDDEPEITHSFIRAARVITGSRKR